MGKNGLKNFKTLRFYVSDKESKRLVCSGHLPPRLVSLTVTLLLEVRTGALWEETQESRVRRQMKVFLSLARKVLRELLESNLRLVIIALLLSDPTDCSTPGSPVLHYPQSLLRFMSIESVMLLISIHLILYCPFSSCPQSSPASGSFPMSQFFAPGGQSIGVSASASVLPMNIQG